MSSMIISLTHGWVLAGQVDTINNKRIELIQAAVIRVWDTAKGLGGLVYGPTPDTEIDPIARPVTVNVRHVLFTLQTSGWTWPEAPEKKRVSARLAVLPHGWVLVGSVVDDMEEPEAGIHFTQAAVIRRWGTTRGMGQLVDGPTPKTELRPIPTAVHINEEASLFSFPVDRWNVGGIT